MSKLNLSAIILAAGEGKRMKSAKSKVLHKIAGKPMLLKTIEMLRELNLEQIITVASLQNLTELKKLLPSKVDFAVQDRPLGTADAVRVGLETTKARVSNIAVLYGDDTAFYKPQTVLGVYKNHIDSGADITFVTIRLKKPQGLGRIVRKNDYIAIVEEKDATEAQKKIEEVNDGLYIFKKDFLAQNLPKLTPSSVTGELYITDLIELANIARKKISTVQLESDEWHGINTQIELAKANFRHGKNIHIMGISGAGASAVAQIAESYGFNVSGCDTNPKSAYSKTSALKIATGHNRAHINRDLSCLIVSPAIELYESQNEEIAEAKKEGLPVITWQEFQGQILQENKFVIAVAGTYGKSTTTAMIANILIDAGLDPTCEVGARVIDWGQNFRPGKSNYLGPQSKGRGPHGSIYICEADEYNDNFLNYEPDIAVILNAAWDHPDYFKNQSAVIDSYKKFASNVKPGGTIVIGSDPALNQFAQSSNKGSNPPGALFVKVHDFKLKQLAIIGDFRKVNANAALTVAEILKVDLQKAKQSIGKFRGLGRRLEYKGEISGVKFYDDYAVQPYTIEKTANALKEKYISERVLLVLEPHMPTRVKKFFKDFVKAIKNTKIDRVLITNIFLAREKGDNVQLSQKLSNAVQKAAYTGSIKDTAAYVKKNIHDFDVVCSMGAGDSYKLYEMIKKR